VSSPGSLAGLFAVADYRYTWVSQFARGNAQWMQTAAIPLVLLGWGAEPVVIGAAAALQFAPVVLLAPISGVLADRVSKRRALITVHMLLGVVGLIVGLVAQSADDQTVVLLVLSAVFGALNAFEMPVRHALIPSIVGAELLGPAVVLSQFAYNLARVTGPLVVGILAVGANPSGALWMAAGASFVAGTLLSRVRHPGRVGPGDEPRIEGLARNLAAGLRYCVGRQGVPLLFAGLASTLAVSMGVQALLPVYTTQVLGLSAAGYGIALGFMGLGSIAAALPAARLGLRHSARALSLSGAAVALVAIGMAVSLSSLSMTLAMTLLGLASVVHVSCALVQIHDRIEDRFRGRVMGLYIAAYNGSVAIGAFVAGVLASVTGVRSALGICGVISLAFALALVGPLSHALRREAHIASLPT
jgi:MFS family permease